MTQQQMDFRKHIEDLMQQGQLMLALIACTNYIDQLERKIDSMERDYLLTEK